MSVRFRSIVAAAVVAGVLNVPAGCGSSREPAPQPPTAKLTDPKLVRGQHVFMGRCYECHPGGSAGLGPALNDKPLPAALIKLQVRQGMGAMPGFSAEKIPDDDLDALVAYVAALRGQGTRLAAAR